MQALTWGATAARTVPLLVRFGPSGSPRDPSDQPSAPDGGRQDAAEAQLREMCSHAHRGVVLQFPPQTLARALRQRGVDVTDRLPGRLIELDRAGDRVTEKQRSLGTGGEHDAQVARGV